MSEKNLEVSVSGDKPVWEYKFVQYTGGGSEGALNALGKDGWELVAVVPDHNMMILKR